MYDTAPQNTSPPTIRPFSIGTQNKGLLQLLDLKTIRQPNKSSLHQLVLATIGSMVEQSDVYMMVVYLSLILSSSDSISPTSGCIAEWSPSQPNLANLAHLNLTSYEHQNRIGKCKDTLFQVFAHGMMFHTSKKLRSLYGTQGQRMSSNTISGRVAHLLSTEYTKYWLYI